MNHIYVTDSLRLTSSGTAVGGVIPFDVSTLKVPQHVRVTATGNGAYVRLSADNSAATTSDLLVQAGDAVNLSVNGRRFVSVISVSGTSDVSIGALSTGVSGDLASLNLNFTNTQPLDPGITFTRASGATRFNANGVLETVGNNIPRFDYDPTTLAARGLLIEEQRTNLLTRSEEFDNAAWTKNNSSITANAAIAPDGNLTADKLVVDNVVTQHLVRQTVTTTASTAYTFSAYLKRAELAAATLYINDAAALGNRVEVSINLATGVLSANSASGTFSGASASVAAVGNDWYRVSLVGTVSVTSVHCRIYAVGANDGTSGIFVWGAQLEAGSFPTSYIPTTTAAATRLADYAAIAGSNFSPWYNAASGTLYTEVTAPQTFSYFPCMASFHDGTTNNYTISNFATTGAPRFERRAAGVTAATLNASPVIAAGGSLKQAIKYATNDFALVANGGTPVTSNSGNVPTVNELRLGGYITGNGANLNGWLRRISYYPTALPNATLQALTA